MSPPASSQGSVLAEVFEEDLAARDNVAHFAQHRRPHTRVIDRQERDPGWCGKLFDLLARLAGDRKV